MPRHTFASIKTDSDAYLVHGVHRCKVHLSDFGMAGDDSALQNFQDIPSWQSLYIFNTNLRITVADGCRSSLCYSFAD